VRSTGTRWRLPSMIVTAGLVIGAVGVLPAATADPTEVDDQELVFPELPESRIAVLEVDDYDTLATLESYHQIDLSHWHQQTEDGRVQAAAFVIDEELDLLEELGVELLDVADVPDEEFAEENFLGGIDEGELEAIISRQQAEQRQLELRRQALTGEGESGSAVSSQSATAESDPVPAPVDETDQLRVLRADTFTNYTGNFLSIEVRSLFSDLAGNNNARPDRMEIAYAEDGDVTTRTLTPFNDAGQYIYHRVNRPVWVEGELPSEVTVRLFERLRDGEGEFTGDEELVEELTVDTAPWAPYDEIGYPEGFQYGFVPGYLDSVDSTNAITLLSRQYPELTELVKMPHQTNGYQRKGMALYAASTSGSAAASVVNVESLAWGHEGGNNITFAILDTGEADQSVSVDVVDSGSANNPIRNVRVTPATDGSGTVTSTAAEVVAALNADEAASSLVRAFTYRGNAGEGVVPTLGEVRLSDHLNGPTHKIPRGPRDVYMLRICTTCDGSKTGVFAYSQEHAREWVTPVVAVETANRLLRNYGRDELTTRLVDNLDIFIVPSVNPDGTDYSRYDNQSQRRNMTNYCDDRFSDLAARNAWGVDLNRNFDRYSLSDGYSGASTSCTSDIYAGPDELSEPEARNSSWVVEEYENIRFSMNIHTHGGYFMWAPGTYANPGRVPAPRPTLGIEDFFFDASETILGRIAEHRGTVIEPGRTGPIIDVLYSAAGNSADAFYYNGLDRGAPIFGWSFEAGANIYNTETGSWQSPGGFFPVFMDEGWNQSMEFANGIYGMLEVALDFEFDDEAPTTTPNVRGDVNYSGPADVLFDSDEAATIHYTTDGSEPTTSSPTVQRYLADTHPTGGARDGADPIRLTETTTLRWFGVDAAGNEEDARELTVYIGEEPPVDPDPDPDPDEPRTCPAPTGFSDLDQVSPVHLPNVACAVLDGLLQGNDGRLNPRDDIRRDQLASLIARMVRLADGELPTDAPRAFPDVTGGPHADNVDALAAAELISGFADGTFGPQRTVTRAQAASFLAGAVELVTGSTLPAPAHGFADVSGSPHASAIAKLSAIGVIEGRSDTRFDPQSRLTREQMASLVGRALDAVG
jgi:hypothetical protein